MCRLIETPLLRAPSRAYISFGWVRVKRAMSIEILALFISVISSFRAFVVARFSANSFNKT